MQHHRLAPLRYGGVCHGYRDLRPDDAIICFSRKSVLSTAALLEKNGFRASVIYGALPPEARRNEVRKYLSGETDIVVATDAIGMGISLPIRRVVFAETEKFDGKDFRTLTTAEVNQIGGRAGRYGLNEYGEVLVLGDDPDHRQQARAERTRSRPPASPSRARRWARPIPCPCCSRPGRAWRGTGLSCART